MLHIRLQDKLKEISDVYVLIKHLDQSGYMMVMLELYYFVHLAILQRKKNYI